MRSINLYILRSILGEIISETSILVIYFDSCSKRAIIVKDQKTHWIGINPSFPYAFILGFSFNLSWYIKTRIFRGVYHGISRLGFSLTLPWHINIRIFR